MPRGDSLRPLRKLSGARFQKEEAISALLHMCRRWELDQIVTLSYACLVYVGAVSTGYVRRRRVALLNTIIQAD